MKRSGMPCRTTGLTRTGAGLRRTALKSRSAPMRRTGIKRSASPAKVSRPRDTGPTPAQRAIVYARSGGQCGFPFCGAEAVHVHHRRARGAGGDPRPETNLPSALLHLCLTHHMWTESERDAAEDVFGLLMPWNTPDPSKVPVSTRHHPWPVLLDNVGGWTVAPE